MEELTFTRHTHYIFHLYSALTIIFTSEFLPLSSLQEIFTGPVVGLKNTFSDAAADVYKRSFMYQYTFLTSLCAWQLSISSADWLSTMYSCPLAGDTMSGA
jgi:hypothetical protein